MTLFMLADIMRAEPDYHLNPRHLGWQTEASCMLRDARHQEAHSLSKPLAAVFSGSDPN